MMLEVQNYSLEPHVIDLSKLSWRVFRNLKKILLRIDR